jgi:aminopeptidase N
MRNLLRLFAIVFICLTHHFALAQITLPQVALPQDSPVFIECSGEHEQKYCSHRLTNHRQLAAFQALTKARGSQLQADSTNGLNARGYDVLRYDVLLDWTNPLRSAGETGADRLYAGVQTITLRATRPLEAITLDAEFGEIRIDTALVDVRLMAIRSVPVQQPSPANTIIIPLLSRANAGDTVRLILYYTHTSRANSDDGLGFFLYRKGRLGTVRRGNDSVYVPQRLAYTMSQPFGAKRWLPCNDTPSDKVFMRVSVRVPRGYTAISNGLLQKRELQDSTSETFTWAHTSLISPYLMAVTASQYETYTEFYKKVSNPNDSIPVDHYFWKEDDTKLDLNNFNYNARAAFQTTISTMTSYAKWFGEYPFERYGHVVVQPFFAGGMEHQTVSTINRSWLRGSATGIAHEIMHQWFGNKVTCASWEHIWLNEGMASYGEALWYESWGGLRWYNVAFEGFKRSYFQSRENQASIYVTQPNSIDTIFNYATTYVKGAYIHHILRRMVGDSSYFLTMRTYLAKFAYKAATTEDLQRVFEDVVPRSPVPFAAFFRDWIYGSSHPVFSAAWRSLPKSSPAATERVQVTISQIQGGANVPQAFHCALPITFVRGSDSVQRIAILARRREIVDFDLPFIPEQILLDTKEDILCEKLPPVRLTSAQPLVFITSNPVQAYSLLDVIITLPQKEAITLDVVDVLARPLQTLFEGVSAEGSHSFRERIQFPAGGTYFVRLRTSYGVQSSKLLVLP